MRTLGWGISGALLIIAFGCSDARQPGSLINPETGKHAALWNNADLHGAAAKAAGSSTTGFAVCQECHGDDFVGGISNSTCLNTTGCHGADVSAPHSPTPWRGGSQTHTNTYPSNAPICASCHTNGANSLLQPSSFDPGAAPGCFNNTLCHGSVGHPADWENPDSHGAIAKSTPGTATGFSSCQTCHGADFTGGAGMQSCLNTAGCHGATVNAPHSPAPWRSGTRTHTNTDTNNAPVCAMCHTNGAISSVQPASFDSGAAPGCFNNTLCHATPVHPADWQDSDSHGATAKGAPGVTAGFGLCQTCHGNDFAGGSSLRTCLNTEACHGAGVNAPHSPMPWKGGTQTHTTTNPNNNSVCALCHTNGANSTVQPSPYDPIAAPGCFNNTLCHADVGAPHVVPFVDPALHGPPAKADLTYCEACHANPSNGVAGSNPKFNIPIGSLATGCEGASCHATNTAHPVPWKWADVTSHQTAGNMAVACALCHGVALAGGAGPACGTCHTAGSPLTQTNCTSCHGSPPTGTAAPDIAGAHTKHNNLPNVTAICNTCHNNAGTSTANHDYGGGVVDVAFLGSTYDAKTGSASYSAGSVNCSNVSCHGGQTTPSWLASGAIDVNTDCTSCHASGTSQHNGYDSGEHAKHMGTDVGAVCADCHDTTKLASVHFNDLNTTQMTQGSQTINSGLNYNGSSCTFTCHIDNKQHDNEDTW
jgi:predicted CxxxxCH...CXXCH cytochrome family protein